MARFDLSLWEGGAEGLSGWRQGKRLGRVLCWVSGKGWGLAVGGSEGGKGLQIDGPSAEGEVACGTDQIRNTGTRKICSCTSRLGEW